MQGNGFKIAAIVAFLALSIYYLFPTYQNAQMERELASMDEAARAEYEQENYDRIQSLQERTLNLGLDLQGGMNVTLEVGTGALLRELAGDRVDEEFEEAIQQANQEAETSNDNYVALFTRALESQRPGVRLSRYFRNPSAGITIRSSNGDVTNYLQEEVGDALGRAVEIVRQRVDRFGVTEPSIQRQGSRRIIVEMPGIDDPQRIRDLLRGTAKLSFHLMPEPEEVQQSVQRIMAHFAEEEAPVPEDTTVASDTTGVADTTATLDVTELAEAERDTVEVSSGKSFSEMVTPFQSGSPIVGAVAESDTAAVRAMLAQPEVQALYPPDSRLLFTAGTQPNPETGEEDVFYLVGIKNRVELEGDVITDARPDFDPFTNAPMVTLAMNSEGASRWSQITGANVGKNVAIVMDDLVYTYPVIQSRIGQGRTQIEGVTRTEAEDIVTVLKSGALPAPVQIIQERTVGPSLGARSVRQGAQALLFGFLVVALFMVFYYRTSGVLADIALLLNVVLIFGILAAFGATLTLPGVAGIVLTIGMAVDANVLIFDRIREEEAAGKTMRAAVSGGFEKALSAIADANITTFLIGVILYSFGVGPIQGFAVTLMAGIVTSLFSALVATRLLVDTVVERRGTLALG